MARALHTFLRPKPRDGARELFNKVIADTQSLAYDVMAASLSNNLCARDGLRRAFCTVAAIRSAVSDVIQKEVQAEKGTAAQRWIDWKTKRVAASARAAHRFSKGPRRWALPQVFDSNGARIVSDKQVIG